MNPTVLVYDDDCGFCTWSAELIAERGNLSLVGYSELEDSLRNRLPDDFERCAHLVTDSEVYSCGEAVEEALLLSDLGEYARPVSEELRRSETYGDLRELGYRFVAEHRTEFSRATSVFRE